MSLLDPIVPLLGPFGQVLAASDLIVVGLALLGLVCFGLNMVKKSIFETSRAWVGATIALSVVTILFRGMDTFCGCGFYTDSNGALTSLFHSLTCRSRDHSSQYCSTSTFLR